MLVNDKKVLLFFLRKQLELVEKEIAELEAPVDPYAEFKAAHAAGKRIAYLLIKLNACSEAKEWVGERTMQQAWDDCPRGDWMLWIYSKLYPRNLRELTLAKGHCANTVRHLMKNHRSLSAVDAAIAFGEGKITRDELDSAYSAAYAAYSAAYADYAAADADFGADAAAAYAADAAAYAAFGADAAAAYAADAADAADAEKIKNQRETADICRRYLSFGAEVVSND